MDRGNPKGNQPKAVLEAWADRLMAEDLVNDGFIEDPKDKLPLVQEPEEVLVPPTEDTEELVVSDATGAYPDWNYETTRVVSLRKSDYPTITDARERFDTLRREHPEWRWVEKMYWTVAYWCWRIDSGSR